MAKILIADDDFSFVNTLKKFFNDNDFQAESVSDGSQLIQKIKRNSHNYDVVILDVKMPVINGLDACRKIREFSTIPIIMFSSAEEEIDRIFGLKEGADDYVPKSYSLRELLVRVQVILRRLSMVDCFPCLVYEFDRWVLNTSKRNLTDKDNAEIMMTGGMYDILLALVKHSQQVLSREKIMDIIGKSDLLDVIDRTIDVQISKIRQRIEDDPKNPKLIKTVRSYGYVFTSPVSVK